MTQRDLVTHLRAWRTHVERQAHKPLADVRAPAALVLADLLAALGLDADAQIQVLGVHNALRLHTDFGLEWEE